jgi:hypothetical protein
MSTKATAPPFKILYRVSNYENAHLGIAEIRVARSTKESVWEVCPPLFKDGEFTLRREKRDSQGHTYFPTLEEAVAHLKVRAGKMKARCEELLTMANKFLEGRGKIRRVQPFPKGLDKSDFSKLL